MAVKLEIKGLKELKNNLKRLDGDVNMGIQQGMKRVSLFMEREVKLSIAGQRAEGGFHIIPRKVSANRTRGPIVNDSVDTGHFLNSVVGVSDNNSAIITSNLEYAQALEFGTSSTLPRRHFGNSLKRNHKEIVLFLGQDIHLNLKQLESMYR